MDDPQPSPKAIYKKIYAMDAVHRLDVGGLFFFFKKIA